MDYFNAFTKGFLEDLNGHITPLEMELLPLSVAVMTGELAVRFLTDYLNGDTYFKINYPEHNLVRIRAQLTLLQDVFTRQGEMTEVVHRFVRKG